MNIFQRREQNLPSREEWFSGFSRADRSTVALVLALKILLFVFAAQAFVVLANRSFGWLEMWNRWDARIYVDLAREGYAASGPHQVWLAFFPLYPWLVCLLEIFTGDYRLAGLLVSAVASIAAALLLRRLAEIDHPAPVAQGAVWFLLIFPTSYFLHIGYTESLFLALVLGSFLAARTGRWPLAGALGAAACLTRMNGLCLFPALAAEAWLQFRVTRRFDRRVLWLGLLAVGFGVYLALNYYVAGDVLAFSKFESRGWAKKLGPPWVGLGDLWAGVFVRPPSDRLMISVYELVFLGIALAGTVWCWVRQRASYTVWMLANLALITSTSFISSVPRYDLALFPLFLWAGSASATRPVLHAVLSVGSLLFMGLFATRFVLNQWAF